MDKSLRLLAVLLFCFGLQSFAADPAFIVFFNSGKAVKQVNGQAVVLKKGDHLLANDQVTLPDKTELILVCANYNILRLKTKGIHAMSKLLKTCEVKTTSVSSAYFKYVWSQFSHAHEAPEKDPRAYMKNYGAVSRAGGIKTKVNTDTIYHYNGSLIIGWLPETLLSVQVYDTNTNRKLILIGKPAKYANLDSIASILGKPGVYYWDFKNEQSTKFKSLILLKKAAYEQLKKSVLDNVVVTTPAETAYLSGYMFEEKHFLAEASKFYEKALKLAPDNQIYKRAYDRFNQ